MSPHDQPVWTKRRQWMGNLIPLVFWLVPTLVGLTLIATAREITPAGVGGLGIGVVFGWLALNQWGYFENEAMKAELSKVLAAREPMPSDRAFVGFATPTYFGALDAHEDIGFLYFLPEQVVFISDSRRLEISRSSIERIHFKPNPHSVLGLGRWVCAEGHQGGVRIRLLVEQREFPTMLANRRAGKSLLQRIQKWKTGDSPL